MALQFLETRGCHFGSLDGPLSIDLIVSSAYYNNILTKWKRENYFKISLLFSSSTASDCLAWFRFQGNLGIYILAFSIYNLQGLFSASALTTMMIASSMSLDIVCLVLSFSSDYHHFDHLLCWAAATYRPHFFNIS